MTKVAFIGGGGTVGSSAAFCLARSGAAAEIVLIDARDNMARSHAMDLDQAVSPESATTVRAGDWAELSGADAVVLSASLPERNVASRDEYLTGNLQIVREAARHIAAHSPRAVVLVATNPVDVFTSVLPLFTGMEKRRFLGYSWNDTLRFRWALARTLGVSVGTVDGIVVGEHGEGQIPLFDRVTVAGRPVRLSQDQQRAVDQSIRSWFATYQGLQSGRTSGWTSAVGIASVIESVLAGADAPLPCSTGLDGQYGVSGVSLGVPVRLGPAGAEQIVELELTPLQSERFHAVADKVRRLVESVLAIDEAGV